MKVRRWGVVAIAALAMAMTACSGAPQKIEVIDADPGLWFSNDYGNGMTEWKPGGEICAVSRELNAVIIDDGSLLKAIEIGTEKSCGRTSMRTATRTVSTSVS